MVRDIIIHLGDCKTGSTSIQSTLQRGTWAVEGRTLTFPKSGKPLVTSIKTKGNKPTPVVRKLIEHFTTSDAEVGIISSEAFEFLSPRKLAKFIDGPLAPWKGHVRVIAYVRPHASRLLSGFAERSKKYGDVNDLEHYHQRMQRNKHLFYSNRFEQHRRFLGDAFTLRPFVRDALKDGDVVTDFFDFVFPGHPVSYPGRKDENESLSLEDLLIMRMIQRKLPDTTEAEHDAKVALGWNFGPILSQTPNGPKTKVRLHRSLAHDIVSVYQDDAASLDKTFFDGTPMMDALTAAPETALDQPQSMELDDYISPETQRIVEANITLFARLIDADAEHFTWACHQDFIRKLRKKPNGKTKSKSRPQKPAGLMQKLRKKLP